MKKLLAFIMAATMMMSLAACGGGSSTSASTGTSGSAAASAPADSGEVYTLSWAHSSSTNDRLALATEKMAEELKEASGGRIIIEHYPASQMGAERETLEGITLGTVDCAVISSGVVANFCNDMYITSLPYQIDNYEQAWKVYDGEFGQQLGAATEEAAGWKWLGWCDNSLRMFSNSKREIRTPDDMKGLKIRTQENDLHMQIVNSLGASATPVAFSELYTALQQGTIDAQENPIELIYSQKFYEQQNTITLTNHLQQCQQWLMNPAFYEALSDENKAIVDAGIQAACEAATSYALDNEAAWTQEIKDYGCSVVELTPEQMQVFKDAVAPEWNSVQAKVSPEVWEAYTA